MFGPRRTCACKLASSGARGSQWLPAGRRIANQSDALPCSKVHLSVFRVGVASGLRLPAPRLRPRRTPASRACEHSYATKGLSCWFIQLGSVGCWKKITPLLRARDHDVYTPTLTGPGERAHLARPDVSLSVHVEDVVSLLKNEDLSGVVLVGNSSGGMVITGAADQVPERVAHIVYLDAFVPQDGESMLDLMPSERRPPMGALVRNEGQGWLLPRFAPPPWEKFVPEVWGITDEADLRWVLPRLRPTPFGHFKEPLQRKSRAAEKLPRTYIRCVQWRNVVFDRYAEAAQRTPGWRHHSLGKRSTPISLRARMRSLRATGRKPSLP